VGPWNRFRRSIGRIVDDIERDGAEADATSDGPPPGGDEALAGDENPATPRLRAVGGDR
jgi:hypothetical protein